MRLSKIINSFQYIASAKKRQTLKNIETPFGGKRSIIHGIYLSRE
jgi:hypothetical protein